MDRMMYGQFHMWQNGFGHYLPKYLQKLQENNFTETNDICKMIIITMQFMLYL